MLFRSYLIKGKEAIREEIKRIEKVVRMGGYIPHVDHRVPSDVSFDNYLYYLEVKRDTFGIEKPLPKGEFVPKYRHADDTLKKDTTFGTSGIRARDSIRPEENLGVRT